ncbi:MAG: hypothetical protein H0U75_09390 [Legionella sp.]|nr:hypothetical protein [Legionella sp.]
MPTLENLGHNGLATPLEPIITNEVAGNILPPNGYAHPMLQPYRATAGYELGLPTDLWPVVFKFLSFAEVLTTYGQISKGLYNQARTYTLSSFDARSLHYNDIRLTTTYTNFTRGMGLLIPDIRKLVVVKTPGYTLSSAQNLMLIINSKIGNRLNQLLTKDQIALIPTDLLIYLENRFGLIALFEKLITPEQAKAMPASLYVHYLLTVNGLAALREKLITPEQAAAFPSAFYLKHLLTTHGLTALREQLITIEQVATVGFDFLSYLLTEHGLIALREQLITIKQIVPIPSAYYLKFFLTEHGLTALREKLIVIEDAALMPNFYWLDYVLTESGLIALREQLITIKQIASIPNTSYIKLLLTESGLIALREQLITVEQALAMSTPKHLEYLLTQCLSQLREGLITPKQASTMNLEDLRSIAQISTNKLPVTATFCMQVLQCLHHPAVKYFAGLLIVGGILAIAFAPPILLAVAGAVSIAAGAGLLFLSTRHRVQEIGATAQPALEAPS